MIFGKEKDFQIVHTFTVVTKKKKQIVDITSILNELIASKDIIQAVLVISAEHTTCCLTTGEVGEGTDDDLLEITEKIIPKISFRHSHNPSHAWSHMASSLIGPSLSLLVENRKLVLGTWQSVLLIELDGPRRRKLSLAIIPLNP